MFSAKIKRLNLKKSGLDGKEWKTMKRLSSPKKIQDFLNKLKFNFERQGGTHHSVRVVLRKQRAHCFEGALLAAAALWASGRRPLLLDLKTVRPDFDHVVALFKNGRYWGAISKTNHAVLRYREPIYRDIRELAISYFHEYFLPDGRKTLRSFSKPFDLSLLGVAWISTEENLASLAHTLDRSPHVRLLSTRQVRNLRRADRIEVRATDIVEYKK